MQFNKICVVSSYPESRIFFVWILKIANPCLEIKRNSRCSVKPPFFEDNGVLVSLLIQSPGAVYRVTVTCCKFPIGGKVFIPGGGKIWALIPGLREPGSGRGLTDPGSLCTEPPLPSERPIFFLIIFLSLARRF